MGDAAATSRLLVASGLAAPSASPRLVSTGSVGSDPLALWWFTGTVGADELLLVTERTPIGGVHGSCREPDRPIEICGAAADDGVILVVGRAAGASRVVLSYRGALEQTGRVVDGRWYLAVPRPARTAVPTTLTAYDSVGRVIDRRPADPPLASLAR
jgi:hypothetical protein